MSATVMLTAIAAGDDGNNQNDDDDDDDDNDKEKKAKDMKLTRTIENRIIITIWA